MIEKKTMGYIDLEYPQYEAKPVTVIVNSETGKVELYHPDDDDWYEPRDCDRFYPTVEEANAVLEKYKQELVAKAKEVKEYVETMNNWLHEQEEDSPLAFDEDDYLPPRNRQYDDTSYYENKNKKLQRENKYLCDIIRTGFINIKGDSFKVDDVMHIKWGKEKAEIHLTGDRIVETVNDLEFETIEKIFGYNLSNYTYSRLNIKSNE